MARVWPIQPFSTKSRTPPRPLPSKIRDAGSAKVRHLDVQVDAVNERAGNARLVIGRATRIDAAAAGVAGLAGVPAAARIHRRDQHEARRVGHAMVGARNRNLTSLERLAQCVGNSGIM